MITVVPLVFLAVSVAASDTEVVTICPAPTAEEQNWTFRDPEYLRVAPEDEDGDVLVSLKVTVENRADARRRAEVWIRAVDRNGFELFDAVLSGYVPAKGTAILTETTYVNAVTFQRTDHVEVEE